MRVNRVIAFSASDGGDPKHATRMMVTIDRRARASGSPLLDITGGSSIAMEVPAPPTCCRSNCRRCRKAAEDLLKGHQFSLRLQMKAGSGS